LKINAVFLKYCATSRCISLPRQVTIVPEIVRLLLSAAVSVIGKLIFIGLSPLHLVFAQRSLRQCGLGFHKLAHALMQIHARNHQCPNEPQRHLAQNPQQIVFVPIGVIIFLKLKSIRAFLSITVVLYVMLVNSADKNDAGMPTALAHFGCKVLACFI
jgi:hypothetical protein